MTNQYWLVKQEPESYAWESFLTDGKTSWDGVRNFQARNNLRAMKVGDQVLFYASVTIKAVQGVAEVTRSAYPDPTADDGDWSSVELSAKKSLPKAVTLDSIKKDKALSEIPLLRHTRLSVMPLKKAEFLRLLKLGGL